MSIREVRDGVQRIPQRTATDGADYTRVTTVTIPAGQTVAVMPASGINIHPGYLDAARDILKDHLISTGRFTVVNGETGIMRSIDTGTLVSGNIGFRQAAEARLWTIADCFINPHHETN